MIRTILAVIAGVLCGGFVNMLLVMIGPMIIPPPAGADLTTAEGLAAAMPMMDFEHFVFPFLAHALGTLFGAVIAAIISVDHKLTAAMIVGALFLAGGIAAAAMIPAPMWFEAVDVLAAYLPMAWIGARLGGAGRA